MSGCLLLNVYVPPISRDEGAMPDSNYEITVSRRNE